MFQTFKPFKKFKTYPNSPTASGGIRYEDDIPRCMSISIQLPTGGLAGDRRDSIR
jgi:hypothetical protein